MKNFALTLILCTAIISLSYAERIPGNNLDQGGDDCSNAVDLGSAFGTWNGNTSGFGDDYSGPDSEPACWQGGWNSTMGNSPDVTYNWTAPHTGPFTFSLCGSNFNTTLGLYDDTCPAEPTISDFICGSGDVCGQQSEVEELDLAQGQEILIVVDGNAYWESQTSGIGQKLRGVVFTDALTGWAVGWNGWILHTIDGGVNWVSQTNTSPNSLYAVDFSDALTGWAVGTYGTIRHTVDGGTNWASQSIFLGPDLRGVVFTDALTGWVVGSSGTIRHTVDGGANWNIQSSGTGQPLYDVVFTDALTGWVVGYNGMILHTIDGGTNWNFQNSGTGQWLHGVVFTDALTGWAVGASGTIRHTIDGGVNWVSQNSGTGSDLYDVAFADALTGWAVGWNGMILHTIDGGANWASQTSGTIYPLYAVNFTDEISGWTVGENGAIFHTDDAGDNETGDYTLTIEPDTSCLYPLPVLCGTPSETEPNGLCLSPDATTLGCGDTLYAYSCQLENDFDYFAIEIPPTSEITISLYDGPICNQNPTQDILFDYFDENCLVVSGSSQTSLVIENVCGAPQTHYLRVYSNANSTHYKIVTTCEVINPIAPSDSMWSLVYGGVGADYCLAGQQTDDCGYAFAGVIDDDFGLVKTNDVGDTLWSRTYGGTGTESCYSSLQTTDGGYVLAGYTLSYGAGNRDFWLVKTNASGDSLWSRTFGGSDWDECTAVCQTSDGGYALGGFTRSFGIGGSEDFWLVKTDANGNSLWSRTFGGSSNDRCNSIQQTNDGGYILAGSTTSLGAGSADFWLIKTDANGDSLWSKTFGGGNYDECHSVQQTPDSGFILAGSTFSFGAGSGDFWLLKTDLNGDSLWSKTFGESNLEICYAIRQTSDDGIVMIGQTNSIGSGDDDIWAVKTDSRGFLVWSRTYGGNDRDRAAAVSETDDGGLVISGYTLSFGNGSADFFAIKTGPIDFCHGDTPLAPVDVVLTLEGNDARLTWSHVLRDSADCIVDVLQYIVFFSELADGPFWYLGHTEAHFDTTFVHEDVAHYADGMFYQVVSSVNPLPALLELPVGTPKQEVIELLNQ